VMRVRNMVGLSVMGTTKLPERSRVEHQGAVG